MERFFTDDDWDMAEKLIESSRRLLMESFVGLREMWLFWGKKDVVVLSLSGMNADNQQADMGDHKWGYGRFGEENLEIGNL